MMQRDIEDKESAGTNLKDNWKEISRKYTKKSYHLAFSYSITL